MDFTALNLGKAPQVRPGLLGSATSGGRPTVAPRRDDGACCDAPSPGIQLRRKGCPELGGIMTRVGQALCAPPSRPDLGPCPWVMRPPTQSYTHRGAHFRTSHKDTAQRSAPLDPGAVTHRRCSRAAAPRSRAGGEVRAAPALCRRPKAAQRSLTPGAWLCPCPAESPRVQCPLPASPCRDSHSGLYVGKHQLLFINGKAEAQREPVACPESHSGTAGPAPG